MRIVVVGTGYVGLVSGAGLADFGNEVLCVDLDRSKIDLLERGEIPFYEPGLKDLVARNVRERRLRFSTSLEQATRWGEVIFICVGTPPRRNGTADMRAVFGAAKSVAKAMPGYRLIVQKSTVPVGTGEQVHAILKKHAKRGASFDVASNPEFLREGSAVENFMRPDRIVIGASTEKARRLLKSIYAPLYLLETPTLLTDVRTAELLKYAANAFLATKISFVNEMANLAEAVGADIKDVAKGMGLDRRIGPKFLHPGPGFGGSCLPKDTKALRAFAKSAGVPLRIVAAVSETNKAQRGVAIQKTLADPGPELQAGHRRSPGGAVARDHPRAAPEGDPRPRVRSRGEARESRRPGGGRLRHERVRRGQGGRRAGAGDGVERIPEARPREDPPGHAPARDRRSSKRL